MKLALTKKRLTKVGVVAATALLLTSGVSAVFTDSVSTQTQNLNTGTGSLEITGGSLEAKATSSVEDLVPGDSVTRDLFLTNAASYDLATISLEVTDSESGQPMTTDSEGLYMNIEREVTPGDWQEIYSGAPTGNVMANIAGPALVSQGVDHLRVTQTFNGPDDDQSLKGQAAALTYIFTGTQRAATGGAVTQGPITVQGYQLNSSTTGITGGQFTLRQEDGGSAAGIAVSNVKLNGVDANYNLEDDYGSHRIILNDAIPAGVNALSFTYTFNGNEHTRTVSVVVAEIASVADAGTDYLITINTFGANMPVFFMGYELNVPPYDYSYFNPGEFTIESSDANQTVIRAPKPTHAANELVVGLEDSAANAGINYRINI